jgi:hypothetical protein
MLMIIVVAADLGEIGVEAAIALDDLAPGEEKLEEFREGHPGLGAGVEARGGAEGSVCMLGEGFSTEGVGRFNAEDEVNDLMAMDADGGAGNGVAHKETI